MKLSKLTCFPEYRQEIFFLLFFCERLFQTICQIITFHYKIKMALLVKHYPVRFYFVNYFRYIYILGNTCRCFCTWLNLRGSAYLKRSLVSINVTRKGWCEAYGKTIGMNRGLVTSSFIYTNKKNMFEAMFAE